MACCGLRDFPQLAYNMLRPACGLRQRRHRSGVASTTSNSVTMNAATNRVTDPGYSYDANGSMTNDGRNSLVNDEENRLGTSTYQGATANYGYDGNGLRVKKVSGGTTTVYTFSGTKVTAEYVNGAAPASPTREYIYAGSQLLAKIEGGATNYYHADHLSPAT